MDKRTLTRSVLFMLAAALAAVGCNSPNQVLPHSASEQKALDAYKSMTPQQQIDSIQNGPMPPAAKAAMIKKIKDKNGIP